MALMNYTMMCRPLFLAGLVFTITLTEHALWVQQAVHEKVPSRWSSTLRRS